MSMVLSCHPALVAGSREYRWRPRNECGVTVLCLLLSLFLSSLASAQTIRVGGKNGCTPPAYQPSADVDYKDGVDAKGWAVQPADLNAQSAAIDALKNPVINLEIPLAPYIKQQNQAADLSQAKLQFGEIKVQNDNSITLNGNSLNSSPSEVPCE